MRIVQQGTIFLTICIGIVFGRYQRCGGRLTQPRGIIQSPNFPGPFTTPVFCEWVIQAPPKLKIVLYLTQYYLKGFFHVYEYDHYTNKDEYIGERKLATVNCKDEIWSIVAHKPFMVLRFAVQEMGNIHLRVLDHLIDVYGFNITYELTNKHEVDNKWTCSAFDCSYLGHCYASADFSEYKCHCFRNFFGDACHFGPHCNPMINKNMCQNNGSCRYLYGDYVNICQCGPGFYGSMCEQKNNAVHQSACAFLDCEQTCISGKGAAYCGCNHGFRLSHDNRTCIHIGDIQQPNRLTLDPIGKCIKNVCSEEQFNGLIPGGFDTYEDTNNSCYFGTIRNMAARTQKVLFGLVFEDILYNYLRHRFETIDNHR